MALLQGKGNNSNQHQRGIITTKWRANAKYKNPVQQMYRVLLVPKSRITFQYYYWVDCYYPFAGCPGRRACSFVRQWRQIG